MQGFYLQVKGFIVFYVQAHQYKFHFQTYRTAMKEMVRSLWVDYYKSQTFHWWISECCIVETVNNNNYG